MTPIGNDTGKRIDQLETQLRCIREIGLILESTMSFDDILTMLVEKITSLLNAERSTLFLIDKKGDLVSRVIAGGEVEEIRLAPGQGIAGWVARHGHPLNIPDVYQDERFDPHWDKDSGFKTKSLACHPIRIQDAKIIGVIQVLNKIEGSVFNAEDFDLLRLVAAQLTMTIKNSQLVVDLVEKNQVLSETKHGLERANRELDLLLDLEQRVVRSEGLNPLSVSILRRVIDITHAQIGILYHSDETGAEIRVVIDDKPEYEVFRVELGSGFAGWVAAKGREVNIVDPTADPRFTDNLASRIGIEPKNLAAVPLLSRNGGPSHGSLLVANKKIGDSFLEPDMILLRLIAARFSQAMEDLSNREEQERERRLATVGRLLGGVLHDLKSPISVISGYAELLAEKAGDSEAEEYLDHLNQALGRITTMTEEIISFSRGERHVLLSTMPLNDIIDSFVDQITPLLKANRVELKTHIRTSGAVRFDKEKILRAFYNIVLNAIEAMEKGGSLTMEVDRLGNDTVFSFTDTGSGIPDEIQGRVFQSFVTLGKGQGTGLGLAVAREIVEAHGGTISFTTGSGIGTTFLISIPS